MKTMKKIILLLTLIPILTFAQTNKKENVIKMTTEYGSENQEFQDILTFQRIDYYKTKFSGADLKGKNYSLIVKEVWKGKIKKIDTIINSAKEKYISPIKSETFNIRVTSKKVSEKKLKVNFRFPGFGSELTYKATKSDEYSLRDVGTKIKIKYGNSFYAFAYILPYEKGDYKYWCAVEDSGKNIENWGKEFGIKHYLIFEMKFE
jgi:hypothetical protein